MTDTRRDDLAYWITERDAMRRRREQPGHELLTYGYSDDPFMGEVRYCNVRREDDTVTKWIATNWRNGAADDPNLTLAMTAARMINWPPALKLIGYPMSLTTAGWMEQAKRRLKLARDAGEKIWSAAYIVSTCGRKMDKVDYVFDHVLRQVASELPGDLLEPTLAGTHRRLMTVDGLGSFLAAQVVADLKNTPGHPLQNAPDWWTWAAPGPGSLRGLKEYFRRKYPIRQSEFPWLMRQVYTEIRPLEDVLGYPIHMQDLQNCMCEFSKYIRYKEGNGRVRNKYTPR